MFAHARILLAKVEEQWTLDVFHDNVHPVVDELVVIRYDTIVTILKYLYDAFVLHLAKDMHLLTDIVHSISHHHIRRRHNFNCELEGWLVNVAGEPNLACAAATDDLDQVIGIVQSGNCHLLVRGE